VMDRVKLNNYKYIEQAVGIDVERLLDSLVKIISYLKRVYKNILVHVHQYKGSTILADTLYAITGVKCITDKTNFVDNPVYYVREYPTIDCLLSLSQCAGLGVPTGDWIIPTGYIPFNVEDGIIYTGESRECSRPLVLPYLTKTTYGDELSKYGLNVHYKPILTVSDLWNPDVISDDEGYLILDKINTDILDFVKKSTRHFDDSHNYKHALEVAKLATKELKTSECLQLALLHDVCDHKYKDSIPRSELSSYLCNGSLGDKSSIDSLIEKVSFTYEKANERPFSNLILPSHLIAVRNADRFFALGNRGIERCEDFVRSRGGKVPEDVVDHCYEKLLRLIPDKFITNVTREFVQAHNIIVDYVNTHRNTDNQSHVEKLSFV
jgi:HD superfamily phosphodiesterase